MNSNEESTVRDLRTLEEFRSAVEFQNEVWGPGFTEAVPASMQKVTQRIGGVVAGAFSSDGILIGFVYGITGLENGELLHWSDILAVRAGRRNGGIGRRLKEHQRARCLELGVRTMRWTFDPLESRNAHLNLERLGAVADEYVSDMYGASDSPLHRGLGTDRLVVRWDLESDRVGGRLEGRDDRAAPVDPEARLAFRVEDGRPVGEVGSPDPGRRFGVPIPADIQKVKDRDPEVAAAWRTATRAALDPAIRAGWEVRALERPDPDTSVLLLEPPSPDSSSSSLHAPSSIPTRTR